MIEKKHHRKCSCGSQFQIYSGSKASFGNTSGINWLIAQPNKTKWLFICDNESSCCEVVSMHIVAKTEEEAWEIWDAGFIEVPVHLSNVELGERFSFRGNAYTRAEYSKHVKEGFHAIKLSDKEMYHWTYDPLVMVLVPPPDKTFSIEYYCPMHPQVIREERSKPIQPGCCIICGMREAWTAKCGSHHEGTEDFRGSDYD